MIEEGNESVSHEEVVHQQEVAQPAESDQHDERQEEAQAMHHQKRNDAAHNWAEARRKMQELERRNREYEEELLKLKKPQKAEEDELGIDDDALVEGKTVKQLKKELKELKSMMQQKELAAVEDRLQMKFNDFNDVVSEENIAYLKLNEPELAYSLQSLSHDPYAQGVAAYKLLKKVVGSKPQPQQPPVEKKKAIENSQKPMSVQAAPKQSVLGNAHIFENGLTPELKRQLWQEMQQAKRMG